MNLFSLTLILLFIMDPVGNIPAYLGLVKEIPAQRQRWIVLREMLIALAVMIFFNELGEVIFNLLGFSEISLFLASGLILFLVAIKIIFPSEDKAVNHAPAGEPFIFPLAIPLIAGPALLASILLYAHLEPIRMVSIYAILIAWFAASFILLTAPFWQRILGTSGLTAIAKLIGMVLVVLAIQRVTEGIQLLINSK